MVHQARSATAKRVGAFGLSAVLALGIAVPVASQQAVPAHADPTSAEIQAEASSVLAQLNSMQEQLDTASNDYFAAVEEQQAAQAAMDDAQARIDEATAEVDGLQGRLSDRVRSMYKNGSFQALDFLLGATSFSEFANGWGLITRMNQYDADLVAETQALRDEIEQERAEYAEQERVARERAEEAARIRDEAQATVDSMQATYDSLSAEAAALLEQERAAEEAAQAANAQQVVENSANNAPANGGGESGGGSSFQPSYNPVTGNAVVDRAYGCLGAPYVWGGVGPNGFDCSGLVSYALTGSYTRLGTTTTFMSWPQVSDPQPGDVCTSAGHCGIYIGGGQMIHAATYGVGVVVGPVQGDMIIVRPY